MKVYVLFKKLVLPTKLLVDDFFMDGGKRSGNSDRIPQLPLLLATTDAQFALRVSTRFGGLGLRKRGSEGGVRVFEKQTDQNWIDRNQKL